MLNFQVTANSLREVKAGTWRQKTEVEIHGGTLLTGMLLLACSDCFLIQLRTMDGNIHTELGSPS